LGGIRRMEATPEVLAFLKSLTPKIIIGWLTCDIKLLMSA
jgi:hypothetical protein